MAHSSFGKRNLETLDILEIRLDSGSLVDEGKDFWTDIPLNK